MNIIPSALYVDFDNMAIPLQQENTLNDLMVRFNQLLDYLSVAGVDEHIYPFVQGKRLFQKKAVFYNPRSFGKYAIQFLNMGFLIRECPVVTASGKTSTDIHICVEMMDDLYHRNYEDFVLISCDVDFAPVLLHINAYGKRTVQLGIGEQGEMIQNSAMISLNMRDVYHDLTGGKELFYNDHRTINRDIKVTVTPVSNNKNLRYAPNARIVSLPNQPLQNPVLTKGDVQSLVVPVPDKVAVPDKPVQLQSSLEKVSDNTQSTDSSNSVPKKKISPVLEQVLKNSKERECLQPKEEEEEVEETPEAKELDKAPEVQEVSETEPVETPKVSETKTVEAPAVPETKSVEISEEVKPAEDFQMAVIKNSPAVEKSIELLGLPVLSTEVQRMVLQAYMDARKAGVSKRGRTSSALYRLRRMYKIEKGHPDYEKILLYLRFVQTYYSGSSDDIVKELLHNFLNSEAWKAKGAILNLKPSNIEVVFRNLGNF